MSTTVDQIKDRLSIVDVVGSYIKLEKAGKNFKAACPFHNEKTPSFFISPDRGGYYCFGCGAKGDIFTFVEEFEGIDFVGALTVLADRAGVEVKPLDPKKKTEIERAFDALEAATGFFEGEFAESKEAQQYLKNRGVTARTWHDFRIGYSNEPGERGWRRLRDVLLQKGFTDDELLRVGLIKKAAGGKIYDTFRGRILFPIADSSGRIVAFSGRVFPEEQEGAVGERAAKYLNSPETPLYRKSELLYGFDKAKLHIRRNDFAILVEGNIDVLLSHQCGYRNTVAPLGTALTDRHLEKVRRLTENLVLALDADGAGVASASRGARAALRMGFNVKIARLPSGMDPADAIVKDPEIFKKSIKESAHIVDFLLAVYRESSTDTRSYRLVVEREVLPYITDIDSAIDRSHFIERVATEIGVPESSVHEAVRKYAAEKGSKVGSAVGGTEKVHAPVNRKDTTLRRLIGIYMWQSGENKNARISATALKARLENSVSENVLREYSGDELVFEAEVLYGDVLNLSKCVDELFLVLEEDVLRESLTDLMYRLKEAERLRNEREAVRLLEACQDATRQIEALHVKRQAIHES